jgi:hypothetical protein
MLYLTSSSAGDAQGEGRCQARPRRNFEAIFAQYGMDAQEKRIGVVVGGSLSKGLTVRLEPGQDVEDLAVGRYVVVRGSRSRFFCMITDVLLDNTNPEMPEQPSRCLQPLSARCLYRHSRLWPDQHSADALLRGGCQQAAARPVRSRPSPATSWRCTTPRWAMSTRSLARKTTIASTVGTPLELSSVSAHLDLNRLVERSIGVFGQERHGQELPHPAAAGGRDRAQQGELPDLRHAQRLRWRCQARGGGQAKGLVDVVGRERVAVCTLDPDSARRRRSNPDFAVTLPYSAIEPEDLGDAARDHEPVRCHDRRRLPAAERRWGRTGSAG